jgi:hypothetical protein
LWPGRRRRRPGNVSRRLWKPSSRGLRADRPSLHKRSGTLGPTTAVALLAPREGLQRACALLRAPRVTSLAHPPKSGRAGQRRPGTASRL